MDKRDPWDTRMSHEDLQNPHAPSDHVYGHVRQRSAASAADEVNESYEQPNAVNYEDLQNPHAPSDHVYGHVRQGSAASAADEANGSYEQPNAMNYNRRY